MYLYSYMNSWFYYYEC